MSVSDVAFKVPEWSQTPQRLKPGSGLGSPAENTSRNIYRTPEKQSQVAAVDGSEGVSSQRFSDESDLQTPEEPTSRRSAEAPEHGSPGPPHRMNTRSGRSPGTSRASPLEPKNASASAVSSPANFLTRKKRSNQGVGTRNGSRVRSAENLSSSGSCPAEDSQASDGGSGSSQLNSTSTEDDSLDIVDAAVTKTQFTGGLKINISFSRKNSQSENLVSSIAPKPQAASGSTPGRSYGFRQTPDRQQREAAARLGYGNQPPRFSTPRGSAGPRPRKETGSPNLLSYQVEIETQTSGVPKLKLKRTDSISTGDSGAPSPAVVFRPSQLESPKALFSKQREPGRVSPSICAHTPAKSTPGKGLQTFICQSYTPTRQPGGTAPPVAVAESVPLTPSPQGVGKMPPDNLNSWPRRKRAQPGAAGGKERGLMESVEEAELGVRKLQDAEDVYPAASTSPGSVRAPLEDFYWMNQLALQADSTDPQTEEPATQDSRAGEEGAGGLRFSLTDLLVCVCVCGACVFSWC